jgi:ATP-dependent DNA ligase
LSSRRCASGSPDLRVRVAYRGVTTAGELRHASFKGLKD